MILVVFIYMKIEKTVAFDIDSVHIANYTPRAMKIIDATLAFASF